MIEPPTDSLVLARQLVRSLAERRSTFAVAESLTGGMLAAVITSVPGASKVFLGGVVSYSDRLKEELLGVPRGLLDGYSAVSAPVALAMADGARTAAGVDLAIATTGEAGPDSASGLPVGTVFVAVRGTRVAVVRPFLFEGDRGRIREETVRAALRAFLRSLPGDPPR